MTETLEGQEAQTTEPVDEVGTIEPREEKKAQVNILKTRDDRAPVQFGIRDIVCLFVEKEKDRPELISAVRAIKGPRYTPDKVDLLVSKIVSVEQIRRDF